MTTILKDVSIMALNDTRIEVIRTTFAEGESTKQRAFGLLVDNNVADLEPYVEVKQNGSLRLVRGAAARQRKLLEATGLNQRDLASSYIIPSVQLAKASIEGENSEAYNYVIENLTEMMDPAKGDITEAPAFTPNRLSAAGKELSKKENSKFEVDADEGLLLNGKRFGSYTIEEIKLAIRTGSSSPDALDMLLQFVGMDEEESTSGKEKLGTVGAFIKKVREAFAGTTGNEFALDACETLEATMFDLRDSLITEQRLAQKSAQHKADQQRAQRRLDRAKKTGAEREAVGASVTSPHGDAAAEVESDDGQDEESDDS
jgi:hypothetical protein